MKRAAMGRGPGSAARPWLAPLSSLGALLLTLAAAPALPGPLLVWESTIYGGGDNALRWPVSLASAAGGELAVADARKPRIVIFRETEGRFVDERSIALPGAPAAIAALGDRYAVVTRGPSGLLALDRKDWGLHAVPLPRGTFPCALAATANGDLLVLDEESGEALLVSSSGGILKRFAIAGRPRALAAAAGGGFYAALPDLARVDRYGADGAAAEHFGIEGDAPLPAWPVSLAVDARGRLLVIDRHGGRIVLLDAAGHPLGTVARGGWDDGQLHFPAAVAIMPDGRVAIADQGNGRAQIFRRAQEEAGP